jgi:hypothetical protein
MEPVYSPLLGALLSFFTVKWSFNPLGIFHAEVYRVTGGAKYW